MASDKIKEWVQQKLEDGIDEDRIKESLKNTGHDPGLVEQVKNSHNTGDDPFEQEESENQEEKDRTTEEQEMDLEFDSSSSTGSRDEENKQDNGSGISIPDFTVSIPSFSVPGISGSRKMLTAFGMSFVILVGMLGVFGYMDFSGVLEPVCSGDQGAGVKVYSVEAQGGITTAEVRVVEEVNVVLEVFRSGEKIAQNVETMNGRGTISVDAVGHRISFHEYGCEEPSVERGY